MGIHHAFFHVSLPLLLQVEFFLTTILPSPIDKYDEFFEVFVAISLDKVFPKQKKLNNIM
jgi:hypothetical protein